VEHARPEAAPPLTAAPLTAAPAPPPLVAAAFAGIVVVLGAGGFLTLHQHRAVALGAGAWVIAAAVAAIATAALAAGSGHARRLLVPAGIVGVAVAGGALGATGYPEAAVIAAIPLAWLLGTDNEIRLAFGAPLAAAAAGAGAWIAAGRGGATALLPLAAALAKGAAEAERDALHRLRTEMVTTVSHELRTPLTVIQGATATLNRRWDVLTETERLDLIDVLTENVASLDASMLHFVDAARLERGEVVLTPRWVDVAASVTSASAHRMAALAGHEIRTDLTVRSIWADPTALERILEHLLMNAARFSALGLPIIVRTTPGVGEVTLAVVDRGQGIAPHLLATVWEPLQRGDVGETGISRGAGLGLPIVRELARLHGGEATLRSWKGRGTTVTVNLPQPAGAPGEIGPGGPAAATGLTAPVAVPERRNDPPAGGPPHRGALSRRVG